MGTWTLDDACGTEPASAISSAIQGRRSGLHCEQTLFQSARILNVVEILQDFTKSLISNEKAVFLGAIFHFPPAPPSKTPLHTEKLSVRWFILASLGLCGVAKFVPISHGNRTDISRRQDAVRPLVSGSPRE